MFRAISVKTAPGLLGVVREVKRAIEASLDGRANRFTTGGRR
jgi:hypothetical protein